MGCWINKAWMAAFALVLAASPFAAEAKPKDGQTFGDWMMRCDGNNCQAFQRIGIEGGVLLELAIGPIGNSGEIGAVARVPLGVNIPAGVAVKIDDGAQIPMQLTFCLTDGCNAGLKLDKNLLSSLSKAKRLLVGMLPNGSTQPVTVNVSVKGLTDAIKAFQ